jgi:uncharacterized membrane protein YfcA
VALPGTQPAVILGTNKLPASLGTATATITYLRRLRPNLRIATFMAIPAFIGSALGARVATLIPREAFQPIILIALILVFTYTFFRKELGLTETKLEKKGNQGVKAVIFGSTIGFYDGIFGPGTGSFLMLVLVAVLGYAFLEATVTTKIVNLSTNIGALLVYGNREYSWRIAWGATSNPRRFWVNPKSFPGCYITLDNSTCCGHFSLEAIHDTISRHNLKTNK